MLNQRGSISIIVGVVLLLLIVGVGSYYFGTIRSNNSPTVTQNNLDLSSPSLSPTQIPTSTPSPSLPPSGFISEWKVLTLPTLGLKFRVPKKISDLGDIKEEFDPGDTGKKLCVQFAKKVSLISTAYAGGSCETDENPYLLMGTTSKDYSAGREGTFTDLEGFTYTEGKYFDNFVGNTPHLSFDQSRITKIENSNGVEIIKIAGRTEFDEGPTISNSLANNTGALINTRNSQYPGLAIIFETKQGLTQQEVDQILKSFEFIK